MTSLYQLAADYKEAAEVVLRGPGDGEAARDKGSDQDEEH